MDNQTVDPTSDQAQVLGSLRSPLKEEVETSIRKEGISYIFESRSVSAVLNFVYTPIDGTFADLELEINGASPIKPAEEGGLLVDMGGRIHSSDSEEVERHFISCEQLENCVEARWQWIVDEEMANFLYRFRILGKSLVVEVEGGNGKAAGLSLGRVTDAPNAKLITVPYFNFGETYPRLLRTSGLFLSSFVDWQYTQSTALYSVDEATAAREMRLNGGCTYEKNSSGQRAPLQERWLLTASNAFDEAFPNVQMAAQPHSPDQSLSDKAWYNIPYIEASEESYVEIYENLRILKQLGIEDLAVNHPNDTWHDGDGNGTFSLEAAPIKGGDDALTEYIDALKDLGFSTSLQTNFRDISADNPDWNASVGAQNSEGQPVVTGSGTYLFKPSLALQRAEQHAAALVEKYESDALYLGAHTARPPWDFTDCDGNLSGSTALSHSLQIQRDLLKLLAAQHPTLGEGGNHWLYAGILQGHLARMPGENPSRIPPVVDFDLRKMHPLQSDAGMGSIDHYYGQSIPTAEKHGRSAHLSRYIAATAAFGHAVLLPDPTEWGIASALKSYFMLRKLQSQYLRVAVSSIHYCSNGNYSTLDDAMHNDAYEQGQIRVDYENGTRLYANLGSQTWDIEEDGHSYSLPSGSFWGRAEQDNILAYSTEDAQGRLDLSSCDDYLFIDAHGQQRDFGAVQVDGIALLKERKWEIDVITLDCQTPTIIDVGQLWPDRKLPPLRLLAFKHDEEGPEVHRADMDGDKVRLPDIEDAYMYRITLPEWMVEPGK